MYGLDLLDFFRGRHSWRKLLVLLERLPPSSAYVEAIADDKEYAQHLAASGDEPAAAKPRLSTWTTEVSLLAGMLDRLGELIQAVIAASGEKPPRIPPTPRPVTAVDRARQDASKARHRLLVAEVREAQARYAAAKGGT